MPDAPFDAVLFDLDGVLVESEGIIAQVWQSVLAERGLHLDLTEIAMYFTGQRFDGVLAYLAQQHDFVPPPDFLDVLETRFNAAMTGVTAIEGAAETLRALRAAGVPFAIGSNSERGRLHLKLRVAGLTELAGEHIYDPSWVGGRGKPHPDLYTFAAQQLGILPERCVVIEDSVTGGAAGLAAGATLWGLLVPGHPHPDGAAALSRLGAARVLTSHAELRAALAEAGLLTPALTPDLS
ncbi:HAD family hydrolase [Deinococcus radiodurans]|jgi:haloacid dehalogenase superfamily, subfamily IA, variant 3 with third motif having DD or ED|uniref:Beta-phosphoglucomutase-related protein n=4 Tax=Deinococcus radiodurans TaxID=1299 RepID=Q9RTX8_DEIRA|nr:HAD-IA family hydrolase [Deinococcus radiodurans]AAF11182.1 beta-phosphoglucomutase-related protein [Deinococcus radiodurans R1 = ATCC 13939 = DSM 20539]ANC71267.1 beta-phosphoglucomutase [Deinococcus radiodurans R1 = ATCC 13939 = DSM 20539]QEM71054.1 HAD family hydrolase [Deinococcus radiodurans]QIP29606.1 HAD-IA family hydrolase [Deinococcus radiodurans]QIP31707.1 HAD-IA family hydrolase [Deinococcus radiodurans]